MKMLFTIVAVVLVIDALGFMAWAISGQVPPDDVYVGTITTHALQYLVSPAE